LPAVDIPAAFETLRSHPTNDKLMKLVSYMDRQCIHHSLWSAETWSVYRRAVRTNNDCESWHSGLNRKAETCHLALYKLIMMLFREAKAVEVSVKLLSDDKVQRITSKSRSHVQAKIVKLWNEYDQGEKSPQQLLRACTHMHVCSGLSGVLTDCLSVDL